MLSKIHRPPVLPIRHRDAAISPRPPAPPCRRISRGQGVAIDEWTDLDGEPPGWPGDLLADWPR